MHFAVRTRRFIRRETRSEIRPCLLNRPAARRVGGLKPLGGPLFDRPWQVNVVHEDGCSRRGERLPLSNVARDVVV